MSLRFYVLVALFCICNPLETPAQDESVYTLIDDAWEYQMQQSPLFATRTGDHRFNDQLPPVSIEQSKKSVKQTREFLKRAEAIVADGLSDRAKLDKLLFERSLKQNIEEFEFKTYLIPITNRYGFHIGFPETRRTSPFETTKDYENYIQRLGKFRAYSQQHIELMRVGIEKGFTLPSVVLQGYAEPIETHICLLYTSDAADE